jgi:hypothetical protein
VVLATVDYHNHETCLKGSCLIYNFQFVSDISSSELTQANILDWVSQTELTHLISMLHYRFTSHFDCKTSKDQFFSKDRKYFLILFVTHLNPNILGLYKRTLFAITKVFLTNNVGFHQWLIAQLVERSLSVMKDPGSNIRADICSFRY